MTPTPPSPVPARGWRSLPWLFFGLCGYLAFNLITEAQALVAFINDNFGQGHPDMDPRLWYFFIHCGVVSLSLGLVAFRRSLALYPLAIGGAVKVLLACLVAYQGFQKIVQLNIFNYGLLYLFSLRFIFQALGYLIGTWYILRSRRVRLWLNR